MVSKNAMGANESILYQFYLLILGATVDTLPPPSGCEFPSHRLAFSVTKCPSHPKVPAEFAHLRLLFGHTLRQIAASMPRQA